jgi:hypothetical protein
MGLGIAGCSLDSNFSDLGEKLLDPNVQGLDAPGKRILAGPHFDLSIQPDEDGSRYALARNADSELVIANFEQEVFCRAGKVARYGAALTAPGREALIPVLLSDDTGPSRLTFANFDCGRSSFEVATEGLPLRSVSGLAEGSGSGILIKTPDQGLVLVDPWVRTTRKLAEQLVIDPGDAFDHYLWVDRGTIVISDTNFNPVSSFGQAVTEITTSAPEGELAYLEREPGSSGGRVFVIKALSEKEPTQVADDACSLQYLTVEGRRMLAYFSPCSERQLVLADRKDGTERVISSNVWGSPAVRNIGGTPALTYLTTPDPMTSTGTLWLVRGDGEPIVIADNARATPSAVTPGGGLLAVQDWSNTGGRLVQWKDDVLTDVADSVIELNTLGLLAGGALTLLGNYDGTTGDLMRLNTDLSTDVLASGVPRGSAVADAFIADFDGQTGELRLLNRTDGSSLWLANGVTRGSFLFTRQFNGLMMLSDRDAETNTSTLSVRLIDSMRQYVLNTGVTEAREVSLPSPGLLYNVAAGDQAGVWFSKAL